MSTENEALARRFFEEVCNARELDVADEILAPGHRYHDPQSPPGEAGPEGMKRTVALYQEAVDGHWDVHRVIAAGDYVTVRWTGRGTHVGELMGLRPSGRRIEVEALTLLRIEDGRIAENWTTWDALGMLRQLGAVPEPGRGERDITTLRDAYAAFARGDIAAVLDAFHEDIEWYSPDEIPTGGSFHGVEQLLGFFMRLSQEYEQLSVEPREYIPMDGGRVLVTGSHRGRVGGQDFEARFAHLWTMRAGRASRFEEYSDTGRLVRLFEGRSSERTH